MRSPRTHLLALTLAAVLLPAAAVPVDAQYFGRNKVQYDRFDFRVLETPRFRIHYYPEIAGPIEDVARMSERWYERLARTFEFDLLEPRPLIFYASHPHFQQTNVLSGTVGEGTGGVTEGLRDRVIMPLGGSYGDTHHVLGHELVHSFQFEIARGRQSGGVGALMQLPLWFVEGMAEYLSLGPSSTLTATWLRDAVHRDEFPTLRDMTRDQQRYFPYRFGHAFWAFVGGAYGDAAVAQMLRVAVRDGLEASVRIVLGTTTDELSARWRETVESHFRPRMEGRTPPAEVGTLLLSPATGAGMQNVAPSLSPDGRWVAFLSERDLFTIELFLADARTGEIVRRLTSSTRNAHFDAIRFIDSSGGWSPDGERIAVSVFADGRNRIHIHRTSDGRVVQQVDVPRGIDEIRGPVFAPDGGRIAFSGQSGGVTDLFEVDPATGEVTRWTNDRYSVHQPTYSPDGSTLAFVTDRGPGTDFDRLTFGPTAIGLLDRATGEVRVESFIPGASHWNPQFTPDGLGLYFLADPDGFRDVYRVGLDDGSLRRVTRVTTAISGITDATPALTVASGTGSVAFSVFDGGEFHVYALDAQAEGEVIAAPLAALEEERILPGGASAPDAWINRMLGDADAGLPPASTFRTEEARDFRPSLGLDFIGQASVGVGADRFGTYLSGAVSAVFSDMLGNRTLYTALQAQGELQDIGGQVFFLNQERRWNWGLGASHMPYRYFQLFRDPDPPVGNLAIIRDDQRTRVTEATGIVAYPFSMARRVEFGGGYTRYDFDAQREFFYYDALGRLIDHERVSLPSPESVNLGSAFTAFVEDNSFFGFTSPVRGWRARYEVGYTGGDLQYGQVTLDHRRYFAPHPNLTIAVRGMQVGRYGSGVDRDDSVFRPLFVGMESLIRGYSYYSFQLQECTIRPDGRCAEFERLLGHRIGVVNLETRIPLLGTDRFGLISFPYLPTELVFFADAGVAWNGGDGADLRWDRSTPDRVPVASLGSSARMNLLGALILEVFYAYPFQRPDRGAHFGVNFTPGW